MVESLEDHQSRQVKPRSKAWVFYAVLAVLTLVALPGAGAVMLLGTVLFGGYAWYLYRGGSIVIWFW
ncbi:hypothetical protein [Streptomyces sp. NPDC005485]|uniref:hypothetical protein n=1 Tax=Streptomyces sp. NPDC005485 TaxID=3155591 RepID=UPI0033B99BCB